jgi:hypothetical protein
MEDQVMNTKSHTARFQFPRLALIALVGLAAIVGSSAPRAASANTSFFGPGSAAGATQAITMADLQGKWAMTLFAETGCGFGTSYVTFRLNASGTGTATIKSHTAGCGDPVTTGLPITILSLNADGSGTAGLSCGTGCGWALTIQVAPDKNEFNVVDVDPSNPGNYLEGIAIRR